MPNLRKMAKRLGQLAAAGDYGRLRRLAGRQNCRCRVRDTGQTPLMLLAAADAPVVATWRQVKCAELLMAQGTDPKATDKRAGETAAHTAARAGNLALLAALPFEAGKFAQNSAGLTPLMLAAEAGRWGCAKHLVHLMRDRRYRDRRKALLGARDRRGMTAVELAEAAGHAELAEVVRTETRGLTFKEKHEAKELMNLANRAPPEEFQRLATRANCDWPHAQWFHTCLSCLARRSAQSAACLEAVRWLLAGGADPTSANVAGWTVLHAAAEAGASDAVRELVAAGAAVNAPDQDGGTPLMEAAAKGRLETARTLLELGANWELAGSRGNTAAAAAAKSGVAEMLALMQSLKGKCFFSQDIGPDQSEEVVADEVDTSDEAQFLPEEDADDGDALVAIAAVGSTASTGTSGEVHAGGIQQLRYHSGDFYPVTDPQGFCLVINVNKYTASSGFECRDGSERDVERIGDLFARLKFKVVVQQDVTVNGILNCLHEAANSEELDSHGCFVCFLMAHGTNDSIYGCDGRPMEIKYLAARFQANICAGLEHKPKVFFLQACRGSQPDVSRLRQVRTDSTAAPVKDPLFSPTESDFLFCYANTESAPAYRNQAKGSVFIQTLCDVIEREHRQEHLLDIMTKVNRRVKENPVRVGASTFYHSVPEMRSQLSKKVSLDPAHAAVR